MVGAVVWLSVADVDVVSKSKSGSILGLRVTDIYDALNWSSLFFISSMSLSTSFTSLRLFNWRQYLVRAEWNFAILSSSENPLSLRYAVKSLSELRLWKKIPISFNHSWTCLADIVSCSFNFDISFITSLMVLVFGSLSLPPDVTPPPPLGTSGSSSIRVKPDSSISTGSTSYKSS